MAQGIPDFGAASIGALRAAELDVFVMRGVGRVYEDYRDRVLEDDDEVALLHGPAELGYPPLTEAMVNIRATVAAASATGVVGAPLAGALLRIGKGLFYKERSFEAIFAGARAEGWADAELCRLRDWLATGRVDRKRQDALLLLDAIAAALAAGPAPVRVSYTLADTVAWRAARRAAESG
jgi:hypothetical protein